ncbi:MAG: 2,3,4,5-tetrahydropyridine-2,6-dicarboxylate N-acetyltransferase [Phycisphaerae bacterium]|nr:2,3,4,5-tetrahydropyridine-2,6-dicarboxylate N-acetyltransferase [Phycisphaerae bacterium]
MGSADRQDSQQDTSVRNSYATGGRLPVGMALKLLAKGLLVDPLWMPINHLPGAVGMKLRQWAYRCRLGAMGRCSLVGVGVVMTGLRRIRIGEHSLIDRYVQLSAQDGSIAIGSRCHLAPNVVVLGGGGVVIEDFVGIASSAKIYSVSEWPTPGKRLAGPMLPDSERGLKTAPVKLEQDSFLGANVVVLPGVTVGRGAVVGANSVVSRNVEPWSVVMGVPAVRVGQREPLNDDAG